MVKLVLYIGSFFILANLCVNAQNPVSLAKTNEVHRAIWELKFYHADSLLSQMAKNKPDSYDWLLAYRSFIQELVSTKNIDNRVALSTIDQSIKNYEAKRNPELNAYLAGCYLYSAYLNYTNGNLITAIARYYNAINLEISINSGPYGEVMVEQLGLVKLVASFYFEELPLVGSSKGQLVKVESYLLRCISVSEKKNWPPSLKSETMTLAVLMYQYIEPDPQKVYVVAQRCFSDIEISPFVTLIWAKMALKANQFDDYFAKLELAKTKNYASVLNSINLEIGASLVNKGDTTAFYYLNRYCSVQQNGKNVSYAQLKMAWLYFVKGKSTNAKDLVNSILMKNTVQTDEEKQAHYEATNFPNWSLVLIKARLHYDNGDYTLAEQLLIRNKAEVARFNKAQKLEMAYRLGRCYQATHNTEFAEKFYNMAITSGLEADYYYPAYAAYYNAQMFYSKGENEKAETYIKQCLQLDSPIYKESIHNKARLLRQYHQK